MSSLQPDIGKSDRCKSVRVMRAHPNAHIHRILQRYRYRRGSGHFSVFRPRRNRKLIALAFDAKTDRAMFGGSCILCLAARDSSVLQSDVPVAMNGHIGVSRTRIETLPKDQNSLFKRHELARWKMNIR